MEFNSATRHTATATFYASTSDPTRIVSESVIRGMTRLANQHGAINHTGANQRDESSHLIAGGLWPGRSLPETTGAGRRHQRDGRQNHKSSSRRRAWAGMDAAEILIAYSLYSSIQALEADFPMPSTSETNIVLIVHYKVRLTVNQGVARDGVF